MLQHELYETIQSATESFSFQGPWDAFTAQVLSEQFRVKRNTVSHYLNLFVDEGTLLKINTRPVYFLNREVFERRFFPVPQTVFASIDELLTFQPATASTDVFSQVIGAEGSLKKAVDQLKAAAHYPPNGLPVILSGSTGVGKSFLAKIMHSYCVEQGILNPDAPFSVFNCAQYYNNPELITANLFGYVKGAFTGANQDKVGLIEAADGGVLFLDEVHRLPPEGQEKLFTFMDSGTYQRLGNATELRHASVRLLCATTEAFEGALLATFLRRIPVSVVLPTLEERGSEEKRIHLFSALLNEVRNCNVSVELSERALELLLQYQFKGSVGELRNKIKYMFADLYARNNTKDCIHITELELPEELFDPMEQTALSLKQESLNKTIFRPTDTLASIQATHKSSAATVEHMFSELLDLYRDQNAGNITATFFRENCNYILNRTIFSLAGDAASRRYSKLLASIQAAFRYLETEHSLFFDETTVAAVTKYFYTALRFPPQFDKKQTERLANMLACVCDGMTAVSLHADNLFQVLAAQLDTPLSLWDRLFLYTYLPERATPGGQRVHTVIISRGGTASHLAIFTNHLLGKHLIDALDLPLQSSEEELTQAVIAYLLNHKFEKGLILLSDMQHFGQFSRRLSEIAEYPVAVIGNISLQLAQSAGRLMQEQLDIETIWKALFTQEPPEAKLIYPKNARQRVIISCCYTGIGTAEQLKQLMHDSIPLGLNIQIMLQHYEPLHKNGLNEAVFQLFDVIGIVGTVDPLVPGIPFISLDHLISGEGAAGISQVFHPFADEETIRTINNNIVKNFSLYSVVSNLTIIDTEKALQNIEEALAKLEGLTQRPLPNDKKISLFIHLSCMIERLIRNMPVQVFSDIGILEQCQKKDLDSLKESLSVIEERYSVKVPDEEVAYIIDILQIRTNVSGEYL